MERFKFQIGWFFAVPLAYEIEQEAPIAVTKPEEVTVGLGTEIGRPPLSGSLPPPGYAPRAALRGKACRP
jgi:hypothetical protein